VCDTKDSDEGYLNRYQRMGLYTVEAYLKPHKDKNHLDCSRWLLVRVKGASIVVFSLALTFTDERGRNAFHRELSFYGALYSVPDPIQSQAV